MVDPQREKIAVTEARRLEIPVIATGDTNVDPDMIDYIIPANDDAIRAIRLLCRLVSDAAIEGMGARAARAAEEPVMGTDVSEAETASDEMVAAVAAGGTYSFAPEPDEDEAVLPGEEAAEAEAADDMLAEPAAAEAEPAEELGADEPSVDKPRKAPVRKAAKASAPGRSARWPKRPGRSAPADAAEPATRRARSAGGGRRARGRGARSRSARGRRRQ